MRYIISILFLFVFGIVSCQITIKTSTTAEGGEIKDSTVTSGAVFTDIVESGGGGILYGSYVADFVTASGISGTDSTAIDYLVRALVDSSLIDSMYAIYPIAGDVDTIHRLNLLSPYDADTSYRLTFNGTVTHDATGMVGNGTTGYGNTHFSPYSEMNINSYHISFTSATNSTANDIDMGAYVGQGDLTLWGARTIISKPRFGTRRDGSFLYHENNNTIGNFLVSNRDTTISIYIDGVKTYMHHSVNDSIPDFPIYIMGANFNDISVAASDKKVTFATIGKGLDDDQINKLTSIERQYNSMISRGDTVTGRAMGYTTANFPIAIDSAAHDFVPDSSGNANYALWDSFSKGAMITFQQRSWFSSFANYAGPSYFGDSAIIDIDMGAWISPLDSQDVDFIYFTIQEATGFAWDTMPDFPRRLVEKYNAYPVYDSRNNAFADKNITSKFVDTCRVRGIEPILYFNPIRNLLFTPKTNFTYEIFDSLDVVHYNNWLQKYAQELVSKYEMKFLWIDGWQYGPYADDGISFDDELSDGTLMKSVDFQGLYDAIKAVDSTCLIVMNNWADTTFTRFPFDISSNEELVMDIVGKTDDEVVSDSTFINGGTSYYIPTEFICNIAGDATTGVGSGFWYATSDEGVEVRNITAVQSFYDRAAAAGAKFTMSVIPGRNGIVQDSQFAVWRNMVW